MSLSRGIPHQGGGAKSSHSPWANRRLTPSSPGVSTTPTREGKRFTRRPPATNRIASAKCLSTIRGVEQPGERKQPHIIGRQNRALLKTSATRGKTGCHGTSPHHPTTRPWRGNGPAWGPERSVRGTGARAEKGRIDKLEQHDGASSSDARSASDLDNGTALRIAWDRDDTTQVARSRCIFDRLTRIGHGDADFVVARGKIRGRKST